MRLLIYGGCHAEAMRRVLEAFGPPGLTVEHILNFELMARGEPFPHERLAGQDLVLYTPILSKPAYDTRALAEACAGRGVRSLAFTWLQWNGYFPGFAVASFPWYDGWWCRALAEAAPRHASFESFLAALEAGEALAELVEPALQQATKLLRQREQAGAVDIAISDIVAERFRTERLFLTPSHPTPALYRFVFRRLEALTGIRLRPDYYERPQPPPHDTEMPILPAVRRALGLGFEDGAFTHRGTFGERRFTLREFARMHYEPETMRQLAEQHARAAARRAWTPARLIGGLRRRLGFAAPESPP
ncbi:WcbI family polysaccharide biosynthesis putative acetyltransferase [Labrys wisconsinensis]|uniref:Polysaccharide biosynthesis enzyme WcbI domain-containing protein n=1 Tax=Labrys wisconsinensis TaxID=425677 RepID=A0ABU0JAP4_9HYPH|nr:WcbI family polysaccharide biosynthesis putative acetyltransferase [Labrys wisconsinensis]MDQ0471338.1 hypothetical protein [Labrys wisconsinensis]